MQRAERSPATAHGSKGGALPGIVGNALVVAVGARLRLMSGVAVERNAVAKVRLPSGATMWTGIGGPGAPDLFVEVPTPSGARVAVWMECKRGRGELTDDQQAWHRRAAVLGRHAFVVRDVEHAVEIVKSFMSGEVHRG